MLAVGFALALPSNAEINSTNFARKSIPFTFTIYYNLTDDATFKNTQAFSIRINQSHPAVQTIKVGDALTAAKKNAPPEAQQFFPTDLAEQINNEAINRTRMSSDFSDETLLFAVDLSKVGLPTYMGLWGLGVHVSIQLENGNQVMTNGTYFLGNGLSIVDDSGPNFNTPHMNFTSIWPRMYLFFPSTCTIHCLHKKSVFSIDTRRLFVQMEHNKQQSLLWLLLLRISRPMRITQGTWRYPIRHLIYQCLMSLKSSTNRISLLIHVRIAIPLLDNKNYNNYSLA